jgi:hypothetical protein
MLLGSVHRLPCVLVPPCCWSLHNFQVTFQGNLVENRIVNKNKEIIPEGTNTNMNRNNATRVKSKVEQKDSKRVNDMSGVSFKDALVRSNYS